MSNILIVEDDKKLSEWVANTLSADGHGVMTAAKSEDAIDLSIKSRPDVLLIDVMLRDGTGGLRIAEAIKAIGLSPAIMLMSGVQPADLDTEARELGISGFLKKPFGPQELSALIDDATQHPRPTPHSRSVLGVIDVDQTGQILYANDRARHLFERTSAGRSATRLSELFEQRGMPDLSAAETRWVAASPTGRSHVYWHIRAQSPRKDGSRLVVILLADDPHFRHQHLIETILGIRSDPLQGKIVLVVDPDPVFRRTSKRTLSAANVDCYTASTYAQATRFFHDDPAISVLVMDLDQPEADASSFLHRCRVKHPDLLIVGMASNGLSGSGERLGVASVLPKPWTASSLMDLLETR